LQFEQLSKDLFFVALKLIAQVLRDAGIHVFQIQVVLLVGNSTRIQKFHNPLKKFLWKENLFVSIDADEIVAIGASIQAAILQGNNSTSLVDLQFNDVASLDLGIGVANDLRRAMNERKMTIPTNLTATFRFNDNHPAGDFTLCGGNSVNFDENRLLGRISLDSVDPIPGRYIEVARLKFLRRIGKFSIL